MLASVSRVAIRLFRSERLMVGPLAAADERAPWGVPLGTSSMNRTGSGLPGSDSDLPAVWRASGSHNLFQGLATVYMSR